MKSSSLTPLKGIYTATLTPLHEDLSIHHDLLFQHCKALFSKGSHGIALMGTTGEANSFTVDERKESLERLIRGGIPPEKLMVGTGCCSLPDTASLTEHAAALGVGSVLLLPPFYYKQVSESGIFSYISKLIERVNHPNLRIVLYHFPNMSGVPYTHSLISQLIEAFPKIIVGMKDSSGDIESMIAIQQQHPSFRVFAGTERLLVPMLKAGGAGCVSATANVTVALARRLYDMYQQGDKTDNIERDLKMVRAAFEGLPFTGALKAYLAKTQHQPDWQYIRPPNELISQEQTSEIVDKIGSLISDHILKK